MAPEERRAITNAIWLCRSCARIIDLDEKRYPRDTLYRWKREHEEAQARKLGAEPWQLSEHSRLAEVFREHGGAAVQIVIDKPEFWEALLVIELVRRDMGQHERELREISRGVRYSGVRLLELPQLPQWVQERVLDLQTVVRVLEKLLVNELSSAVGAIDGEGADPEAILRVTQLLKRACAGMLMWEEEVARTVFPEPFDDLRKRLSGWTHGLLAEIGRLPEAILAPIREGRPSPHRIRLQFDVPPGTEEFAEEFVRRYTAVAGLDDEG